jgi:hypothetical protein
MTNLSIKEQRKNTKVCGTCVCFTNPTIDNRMVVGLCRVTGYIVFGRDKPKRCQMLDYVTVDGAEVVIDQYLRWKPRERSN